jgi:hypothetical protein
VTSSDELMVNVMRKSDVLSEPITTPRPGVGRFEVASHDVISYRQTPGLGVTGEAEGCSERDVTGQASENYART